MSTQIRQRVFALPIVLSGVAMVVSSAFAQARRYPALPAAPSNSMHSAQTRTPNVAQAPDLPQANYRFLPIDPQDQGHCYIDAHGLNDSRQVVVDWSDTADCNLLHASLWDNGAWTSLDYVNPACSELTTYFTSLNDREIAFGSWWSTCPFAPAAGLDIKTGLWFSLPDIANFPYNQGVSMSNNGLAAGAATNDANVIKHWIWNGRKYIFPAFPNGWDVSGFWAGPLFINDQGQIAGQYVDTNSGRMRGYFQDGAKVTPFDAPGNPSGGTYVNGMTDSGELLLIGGYDESSPYYPWHSFAWKRGVFTALPNVPFAGATSTFVFGLNNRGDISGRWLDSTGLDHAFVAFRK